MEAVKVRTVGNSLVSTLPVSAAAHMNIKEGDYLFYTPCPGGMRMTPYNPEFKEQMEIAENLMARYRNTLKALSE